jgi:hypothetical protein
VAETLDQHAAKVLAYQRALAAQDAWMRVLMAKVGAEAQRLAEREASSDLGGDPKFSGWAPTLDTKFRVVEGGRVGVIYPTRSSAGPWTVAEQGRNNSTSMMVTPNFGASRGTSRISAKTGKAIKGRARKAKRWNGRTAGKGTASSVQVAFNNRLPKIADTEMRSLLRKTF